MGNLILERNDEEYLIDEFYKSLLFQHICDLDLEPVQTSFCMMLLRQTLHYGKWSDNLAIYRISKAIGTAPARARRVIAELEAMEIISVTRSTGGRTDSPSRFNEFEFSNRLIFTVFDLWLTCKENLGAYV